jgi:hypothetical protein
MAEGAPPKRELKKVRRRRCWSCGYMYDLDELHPDYNEDGRQVGLICDSCI